MAALLVAVLALQAGCSELTSGCMLWSLQVDVCHAPEAGPVRAGRDHLLEVAKGLQPQARDGFAQRQVEFIVAVHILHVHTECRQTPT